MANAKVICLTPPTVARVASVTAIAAAVAVAAWAVVNFHQLATAGWTVAIVGTVLFLGIGIDGLQRRYVLSREQLAVRVLFCWRRYDLSSTPEVETDAVGRLVVRRHGMSALSIPREYNPGGQLEIAVRALLKDGAE